MDSGQVIPSVAGAETPAACPGSQPWSLFVWLGRLWRRRSRCIYFMVILYISHHFLCNYHVFIYVYIYILYISYIYIYHILFLRFFFAKKTSDMQRTALVMPCASYTNSQKMWQRLAVVTCSHQLMTWWSHLLLRYLKILILWPCVVWRPDEEFLNCGCPPIECDVNSMKKRWNIWTICLLWPFMSYVSL